MLPWVVPQGKKGRGHWLIERTRRSSGPIVSDEGSLMLFSKLKEMKGVVKEFRFQQINVKEQVGSLLFRSDPPRLNLRWRRRAAGCWNGCTITILCAVKNYSFVIGRGDEQKGVQIRSQWKKRQESWSRQRRVERHWVLLLSLLIMVWAHQRRHMSARQFKFPPSSLMLPTLISLSRHLHKTSSPLQWYSSLVPLGFINATPSPACFDCRKYKIWKWINLFFVFVCCTCVHLSQWPNTCDVGTTINNFWDVEQTDFGNDFTTSSITGTHDVCWL